MASSGPNSPGTISNNAGIGSSSWTNISNVSASDNSSAYNVAVGPLGNVTSNYIWCTNFGFSIPSGSTINGILVEVEGSSSADNSSYYTVTNTIKLIKGGAITGNNKGDDSTHWGTSDSYMSYGSSSDLWGATLSYTDVNASNFGVALAVRMFAYGKTNTFGYVDHIRMTITYTTGGGGGSSSALLLVSD